MESVIAKALRIRNDVLESVAVLELLCLCTLSLAWRLSFAAGLVHLLILIVCLYFARRKRRASPSACTPTTSLTSSSGGTAPSLPSSSSSVGLQFFSGGTASSQPSSSSVGLQSFSAKNPSNAKRPYDVFINHRGDDVKLTLASVLYFWLRRKGLRVFLDQKEFTVGEGIAPKIEQAIDNASVHVAIFSKTYAESPWCLDELCRMKSSRAKIIPVFFDVKRSDLRWIDQKREGRKRKGRKRESVYRRAFARYEENGRHSPQKLQDWKTALKVVSFEGGFDLKEMCNGDWGKLLKRLVDDVLKSIGRQKEAGRSPREDSIQVGVACSCWVL